VSLVRAHLGDEDAGSLGVIVPADLLREVGDAVSLSVPDAAVGGDAELESRSAVLTVRQAKGLEFDSVIVVEPAGILAASAGGARDLYVALTRATQRLGILHTGDLPPALASPLAAHA
jgi:DNA helicase IV